MILKGFTETQYVTELRNAVISARGVGIGFPSMLMAWGEAGTGKTWAARKLHVDFGGVYLRVLEGMTLAAFMQDLCFEVTGTRPHGVTNCRRTMFAKLENRPVDFYIDEPERLPRTCLEGLRDINDVTGSRIIMFGEQGLPTVVSARSRINDRIPDAYRVNFGGLSAADIALYANSAAEIQLSPEATMLVRGKTQGIFRRVYNAMLVLARACKAQNEYQIDADFVRACLKIEGAA